MTNHYSVLGVPNYSAWSVVRKAYILQIKKYHPDVNSSQEAILICQRLNVAKEALETNDKKARYDARLKHHLTYGYSAASVTTKTATRARSYSPPPVSRAERFRQNKKRRDAMKLAEYERGLKKFPIEWRYALCSIYGSFGLFLLMVTFINVGDIIVGLFIGLIVSVLWFSAVSIFINEFYKYKDFKARSRPLSYNLEKRTSWLFFVLYISGFIVSILAMYATK